MNKKKSLKVIVWIVVIVLIILGICKLTRSQPSVYSEKEFDPTNITFEIEGQIVTLKDGDAATDSDPEYASKTITQYFGNDVKGDLDGDGIDDNAFLVTQETGGSGLFYYAVVAITKPDNLYIPTNTFFIGDRIASQSNQIVDGVLNVNYAERKTGEPMSATPSVGVTKILKITPAGRLEEVKE